MRTLEFPIAFSEAFWLESAPDYQRAHSHSDCIWFDQEVAPCHAAVGPQAVCRRQKSCVRRTTPSTAPLWLRSARGAGLPSTHHTKHSHHIGHPFGVGVGRIVVFKCTPRTPSIKLERCIGLVGRVPLCFLCAHQSQLTNVVKLAPLLPKPMGKHLPSRSILIIPKSCAQILIDAPP